jgi:geranylgeranyl diphosphate synthase type II
MNPLLPAPEPVHVRLQRVLMENCPATGRTEPHLRAVLEATVAQPGRLVRAQLILTAAEAHGLGADGADQLACAVEYYHAASLLLDDLPCMDDATMRRGRPCAHRVHGEATAILAALALINRANALAGFAFAAQPALVRLQAQAGLDGCLGPSGLLGGQARDLRFAETARTAREVGGIALGKTGALLWLAVCLPALPADPTAAEWQALKALCVYWGLAYQTADDLQDVGSAPGETGKTGNRDRLLTRPNLALALSVPAAERRLRRQLRLAAAALAQLGRLHRRWDYLAEFHRTVFAAHLTPARRGLAA